ncbi:Myosin-10 [Talaromyces islandicus]|uniref:Myosin-10 n=1 Tax=Talaromyces islandicus TaxID=28573 RepID=A0A0U1M3J1_TALIS|nr:Myosin-10 [Talaromyces islandicus]
MTRPDTTRRSHHAPASIGGDSTLSDFDPEHEAMVSTRQIDHSDRLPDIPASLRTTPRGKSPVLDPEYTVDTSTIQHTFPQISDVESSGEDETDEFSIEIGRGMKRQHHQQQLHRGDDSRNSMLSIGNPSIRSSSPAIKLDLPATSTPPRSTLRNAKRAAADGNNLRKDAQIRRASQMQKENVDPQASRVRSMSGIPTEGRHTLSEMHIKAREAYDGSFIGDERPKNIAVNTRTTRFGNVSSQVAAAVENAQREGQLKESRRGKQSGSNYLPANPTYTLDTANSFLLPDMPNISELVSGVLEDGTPVFPRQMRPRTTRFVSPPAEDPEASQPQGHLPLETVPIPEDEKVLFVSLKLLQDKVADLEFAKSETERKLDDVRQENHLLRTEKARRQKEQHDRLKMFGGDEPEARASGAKSLQEKNKLEATTLALQNKLDIAERKIQVHEGALKSLSHERDSAITQLGVAYLNTQDVRRENETLKQENADLKARVATLTAFARQYAGNDTETHQSITKGYLDTEPITVNADENEGLTLRTSDSVQSLGKSKDQRTRTQTIRDGQRSGISGQIEKEMLKMAKEREDEDLFSLNLSRPSQANAKGAQPSLRSKAEKAEIRKQPNTGKQRKRVIVEEVDTTEVLEDVSEQVKSQTGAAEDFTVLSFIDDREIAQLRRRLEAERAARKQRQSVSKEAVTSSSGTSKRVASDPPRKSSLKEPKEKFPRTSSAVDEISMTGKTDLSEFEEHGTTRRRRHSDHSVASQHRHRKPIPELTSAFILPDITLHHADNAAQKPVRLSESAQKVLDNIARHDGKNCTVCKRLLPDGVTHDHDHDDNQRETITVPKPVPVSERMPEPSVYNEEPTMRPSQPPALALATVLKSLEDELSHLKMQLTTVQNAYTKHDASLSKRQRKSLSARIEKLVKEIDTKSDQIYALYDVLEGQKEDGHEMNEKEVEITLQSIGIDVQGGRLADITGTTDMSAKRTQPLQDSDEEDDDELPWEGIESTGEITGRTSGSRRRL